MVGRINRDNVVDVNKIFYHADNCELNWTAYVIDYNSRIIKINIWQSVLYETNLPIKKYIDAYWSRDYCILS